jgi:hypothetical protein
MPQGRGIYEDEPREHRHTYSTDAKEEREGEDPTPDDSASKDAGEATG